MNTDARPSTDLDADADIDADLTPDRDDELAAALDAYLAEVEAGRPVDPEAYIGRHPAIADRLRACLRGLHLVEAAAESLDLTTALVGGIGRLPPRRAASAVDADPTPVVADEAESEADDDAVAIGDFAVIRELGRGGMGVVYEAVERSLGRRVALKILPLAAAIDPRQIARFRVEAQAASQLDHPHIVPVYSVGCTGGVHYYAMRLIEGPTLAQIIDELRGRARRADDESATLTAVAAETHAEGGPAGSPGGADGARASDPSARRPASAAAWSLGSASGAGRSYFGEVARLGRAAAEALDHAHEQGVLHRDVKPSNLMVDARGHLWVADFGLARFQGDSNLTAPGDLVGTLRYMSPEQATADHAIVDQRTDVYSLGATLYELATLRPVFAGSDRQELLRRIVQEEPRRPRTVRPDLPRDLETIVLKAMAKDPVGRYATAQALAEDLGRFLDDRPILARRPGPMELTARWARRHVAALAVAVLCLAAAVVTLGIVVAKQAEVIAGRSALDRANAEIRRQRDKARRAVDEMYVQFADTWLGRRPALQSVQHEFLQKALAYYEDASAEPDADPSLRVETGDAALRVGDILRTLGRGDEAERAYRRAIALLEAVSPASRDWGVVESLGRSYGGLGQLLVESGRKAEAQPILEHAIDQTRRFVSWGPNGPGSLPLAAGYHRLGTLLRLAGRYAEAEATYRLTIVLAGKLDGPRGRKLQAGVHGNLSILQALAGRPEDADRALREAIRLYRSVVSDEPEVPLYREELARALDRLGAMAADRPGGRPEAERLIREALAQSDRLAADSPAVPAYREELALILLHLSDVLSADGRAREAEPFAARSVALLEELSGPPGGGSLVVRDRLAGALDRLAGLRMDPAVGRATDAEPLLRRSIACREAILVERTATAEDIAAMAEARGRLGAVLAARGAVAEARRVLEAAAAGAPSAAKAAAWLMRSVALAARDEALSADARAEAIRDDAERAMEALRRSTEAGDDPVAPYLLAWWLTACPAAELRDPPEAIKLSREILRRSPASWVAWATLGAAEYRADDPDEAVAALERAAELHGGDLVHYGFFLAMAYHRIDDPERAREAFDRADRRTRGHADDDEVRRLRDEAAALLAPAGHARGPGRGG